MGWVIVGVIVAVAALLVLVCERADARLNAWLARERATTPGLGDLRLIGRGLAWRVRTRVTLARFPKCRACGRRTDTRTGTCSQKCADDDFVNRAW